MVGQDVQSPTSISLMLTCCGGMPWLRDQPERTESVSKAAGDLMTQAYHRTYGMPTLITRSSNNYGPRQYPEKLIPLTITKTLAGEPQEDYTKLITFVLDRPGHDRRYALNSRKISDVLGWMAGAHFGESLSWSVSWLQGCPWK